MKWARNFSNEFALLTKQKSEMKQGGTGNAQNPGWIWIASAAGKKSGTWLKVGTKGIFNNVSAIKQRLSSSIYCIFYNSCRLKSGYVYSSNKSYSSTYNDQSDIYYTFYIMFKKSAGNETTETFPRRVLTTLVEAVMSELKIKWHHQNFDVTWFGSD